MDWGRKNQVLGGGLGPQGEGAIFGMRLACPLVQAH